MTLVKGKLASNGKRFLSAHNTGTFCSKWGYLLLVHETVPSCVGVKLHLSYTVLIDFDTLVLMPDQV